MRTVIAAQVFVIVMSTLILGQCTELEPRPRCADDRARKTWPCPPGQESKTGRCACTTPG
ncbi:hypothetical protein ACWA7J_06050 [Leptothrix sp. BB-4]